MRRTNPKPKHDTKVPSGVVLRVQPTAPQHRLGPFPIEIFKYDHDSQEYSLGDGSTSAGRLCGYGRIR